ncbi:MAG: D-alanyl-D-alanine carboxypeptidase [Calditrichaeota bacterium]|nr:MAG: D-alanyl-D-alanine carboxypeptidase [Calditrichota bacterium]
MLNLKTLPKVLLMLAVFVFFSANTVYILEADGKSLVELKETNYQLNFDTVKKGPYLNLKAALLVDYSNGNVLYAKNADKKRAIASLTKLVTAMVLFDNNVDLDKVMTITKQDAYKSSRSRLRTGYKLTVRDLLHAALLSSDNRAARALARATSGTIEKFVVEMNLKAKELGLEYTKFVEPTGLSKRNVSTAHEIAKILHYSYEYEAINNITQKKNYYVKIINKKNKKYQMVNTNLIVHSKYKVLAGKTGYIIAADYCLTTLVKNNKGEKLTCVVLGVPGDKLRFREARKLIDWGFKQI